MKTDLTLEIEDKLRIRAKRNCERFAFEVPVKDGICDFITSKIDFSNYSIPYVTCYEIKVSFSDFKSENGHNFYGDENYYVMPRELYDEIIEKKYNSNFSKIGVIAYKNGKLYKMSKSNAFRCELNLEEKFNLLDSMMMKILYEKD